MAKEVGVATRGGSSGELAVPFAKCRVYFGKLCCMCGGFELLADFARVWRQRRFGDEGMQGVCGNFV